ncbi:hypothetical protein Fmac_020798 [Flemingia macrophylla]|uniref:Uncharacterized protein n=1 Tax=Flemingia macrophylla TaxID=520843 RepID=A0ABD1LV51_9FABA
MLSLELVSACLSDLQPDHKNFNAELLRKLEAILVQKMQKCLAALSTQENPQVNIMKFTSFKLFKYGSLRELSPSNAKSDVKRGKLKEIERSRFVKILRVGKFLSCVTLLGTFLSNGVGHGETHIGHGIPNREGSPIMRYSRPCFSKLFSKRWYLSKFGAEVSWKSLDLYV